MRPSDYCFPKNSRYIFARPEGHSSASWWPKLSSRYVTFSATFNICFSTSLPMKYLLPIARTGIFSFVFADSWLALTLSSVARSNWNQICTSLGEINWHIHARGISAYLQMLKMHRRPPGWDAHRTYSSKASSSMLVGSWASLFINLQFVTRKFLMGLQRFYYHVIYSRSLPVINNSGTSRT